MYLSIAYLLAGMTVLSSAMPLSATGSSITQESSPSLSLSSITKRAPEPGFHLPGFGKKSVDQSPVVDQPDADDLARRQEEVLHLRGKADRFRAMGDLEQAFDYENRALAIEEGLI